MTYMPAFINDQQLLSCHRTLAVLNCNPQLLGHCMRWQTQALCTARSGNWCLVCYRCVSDHHVIARPNTKGWYQGLYCQLWLSTSCGCLPGQVLPCPARSASFGEAQDALAGVTAGSTGAGITLEAGQEGASPADSELRSPLPGSAFAPAQPMDGDLGGVDFDIGRTGLLSFLRWY